jgi:polyadenylate-binding protein 2
MSELKEYDTGDINGEEHDNDNVADEDDLEKLQAEIAKMEEEAARIAAETASLENREKGQNGFEQQQQQQTSGNQAIESKDNNNLSTPADKASVDKLSIYVGQVDYSTTPEELLSHFEPCGQVERVTINCDKFTGRPKGFAYLEFQSEEAVQNALKLDGSSFKGRNLKVTRKRVNDPNYYYNQMHQQYQQQVDTMHGEAHHGFPGRLGRGGRGRGLPARGGRGFVMIPPPPVPLVAGRGIRGRGRGFGPPAAARGRSYRGGFRGARGGGAGSGYQPYY